MDVKVFSDLDCSNIFKFNEIVVLSWVSPTSLLFGLLLPSMIKQNKKKPQKPLYTNVWVSDWILLPLLLFDISEHSKTKMYRKSQKTAHLHFCSTPYYYCNLDGPIPYRTYLSICNMPVTLKDNIHQHKNTFKVSNYKTLCKKQKKSSISM